MNKKKMMIKERSQFCKSKAALTQILALNEMVNEPEVILFLVSILIFIEFCEGTEASIEMLSHPLQVFNTDTFLDV